MEDEIDLREYVTILAQHWKLLVDQSRPPALSYDRVWVIQHAPIITDTHHRLKPAPGALCGESVPTGDER